MIDPLPPPPRWLRNAILPLAHWLNIPTLAEHIHEALFAFTAYQFIHYYVAPRLSSRLFPNIYPKLNRRTRLNWNVHVVSLVQSTLINTASLWLMFNDNERRSMSPGEKIYGYTGASGLVQALGFGYFLYDLIVSTVYMRIFGIGMVFHGLSALWVFSFGFRPFLNFYVPNFLLYELSSPFLNIHWFLDKLNMTGSKAQWYNGMVLLVAFFSCRLVWGTWQSSLVYRDMWSALKQTWIASTQPVNIPAQVFGDRTNRTLTHICPPTSFYPSGSDALCIRANDEVSKFADNTAAGIPTWLVLTYVLSNLVLNMLNYYWFSKMIDAVMKRFSERKTQFKEAPKEEVKEATVEVAGRLQEEEGGLLNGNASGVSSPGGESSPGLASPGLGSPFVNGEDVRNRKGLS